VMLTAGIFGTLRSVEGDRASVEIADGTVVEIATGAVASVEKPAEAAEPTEPTGSEEP
jgi:preprotein translocase subunit YajC